MYTTLTKVQELLCGILRLLILSFSLCLWECVLPKLREKRIKGAEAVLPEPATERAMVQAVIDERRKELISGFSRFWDLKRYNTEADYAKTITRTFPLLPTDVEEKTERFDPDSRLYIIPFPLAAREKNPNLTMNTNE